MIHCFNINGKNLVLDVNSGALHEVSREVVDILNEMSEASGGSLFVVPENVPQDIANAIKTLINNQLLFTKDNPDEIFTHMNTREPVVKALCLHMAHECNLRCRYCFAGQGDYGTDRGLMSAAIGKQAIDFLIDASGNRYNLEVDFFGGEPMLNFDVVKEVVAYGRMREREAGKKFRFTLTTNGTLLTDEHIQYINETFDNVVLSLDGRKEINDYMRPLAGGGGSYDVIYPKIKKLADARMQRDYYVRGTYTHHNTDFASDVMHLVHAGFKQLSIEPVVAPPEMDYATTEADLPKIFSEYEKLALDLLAHEADGDRAYFFHFEIDLDDGPCIAKRVTGCGAGSEYIAVTPHGNLYPCHQFVDDVRFKIGDVYGGVQNHALISSFAQCHVYNKPECQACWAKYFCSGGCMATAYHTNGDIMKPDHISCELQKKRIECALYMYATRRE